MTLKGKYLNHIYKLTEYSWFQLFFFHLIVWQILNGLAYGYEKLNGLPTVIMWYDLIIYILMLIHFGYMSYKLPYFKQTFNKDNK